MAPKAKVKVSVKPKSASARPDTSSAKSKPATTGGSPAISAEAREEIERLVEQVFKLCDADHGGSIQFTEFLVQHRLIVELAAGYLDDGAAPKGLLDTEEAEENFRKLDADNDLQLNKVEFNKYMDGVLSVIGFRNFTEICKGLIDKKDEFQRKGKKLREGFDLGKSSLLLDTVRSAGNLSEGTGGFINVMKLLSGKADPNFEDQDGCNAVVLAAGRACPVMLTKLIEANADPTVSSPSGDCAVFRAAASQNFLALKFLLVAPKVEAESAEKGEQAEKDEKGEKGEKGQKADIRRNSLRSPRPGTQQGRRPSTRQGGAQEDEDLDKLSETLVTTMPDLSGNDVAELLRRKANVNHKSSSGWTPLTMATFLGKKECVETLLRALGQLKRARAWVNGRNLKGRTALHVAGRKAEAGPIIPVLLRAGADPDLQVFLFQTLFPHPLLEKSVARVPHTQARVLWAVTDLLVQHGDMLGEVARVRHVPTGQKGAAQTPRVGPFLYCSHAATNKPQIVVGNKPRTKAHMRGSCSAARSTVELAMSSTPIGTSTPDMGISAPAAIGTAVDAAAAAAA